MGEWFVCVIVMFVGTNVWWGVLCRYCGGILRFCLLSGQRWEGGWYDLGGIQGVWSLCWFKWGVRWCGLKMEFCVVDWISQMFCRRDWQVSLRFSRWIG